MKHPYYFICPEIIFILIAVPDSRQTSIRLETSIPAYIIAQNIAHRPVTMIYGKSREV